MLEALGLSAFVFVLIAIMFVSLALSARTENMDFAFLHPDDPFSAGIDAQWKGKGPPPSEQEWREAGIRRRAATPWRYDMPGQLERRVAKTEAALAAAARVREARHARREAQRTS